MTVLEGIQRSTEFLAKRGVDTPRLQAELLLAHLLQLKRMQLYLNFERELSPEQTDAFRQMIKRRGQREPLQHILGSVSFCGFEIAVNRQVLVPRPETELLAEQGWTFLHSLSGLTQGAAGPPSALDFGTGSGCIAIALAGKAPAARIHALDVSAEALAIAGENAQRNGVVERLSFVQGNSLSTLPAELRFDLIVSNPPYIPTAEIESLQPEVRDYDPALALDGGPDGLNFYRSFAVEAGARLKPGGKLMLEFGDGQAAALATLFQQQNWIVEAVLKDYNDRPRILMARR